MGISIMVVHEILILREGVRPSYPEFARLSSGVKRLYEIICSKERDLLQNVSIIFHQHERIVSRVVMDIASF